MNQSFRDHVAMPLALVLLPLLVYGNTIFHRYGFRDDYSTIREAREEPGTVLRFCGSQARPLYGWLLENSARLTPTIDDLRWLRAAGALCLGLLAAGCFAMLRRQQWPACLAALTAALLVLLPSAQLIAGWGVCWPHVVAAGLGLAGFAAAERGFGAAQAWQRGALLAVAAVSVLVAALIYQSNAMFYLVGVAAGLGRRLEQPLRRQLGWLAWHGVAMGAGMLLAFNLTYRLFEAGVFPRSPRIAIEPDLPAKLLWSLRVSLPNVLALFVVNDETGHRVLLPAVAMLAGLALLMGGVVWVMRRQGAVRALWWLACLTGLPLAAYNVSILVMERWASYRTLYAGAAVVLVFVMTTLGWWWRARSQRRRLCLGVLAGATFAVVLLARWQAYTLIALPQALELRLLEEGARAIDPAQHPRVFILTPRLRHAPAALRWGDEFGSLSMDSDWTPKEALKHIMRASFPEMPDVNDRYVYASGSVLPKGARPDVVIDLQRISGFRGKLE
jgi:hypothetical protein